MSPNQMQTSITDVRGLSGVPPMGDTFAQTPGKAFRKCCPTPRDQVLEQVDLPFNVSVIVPSYNDADVLVICLEALMKQNLAPDNYEVIVVDDGSTDNTRELVASFCGRGPKVSYYYQKNQGPATARNFGATVASGEVIMFTDADCEPWPNWIAEMAKPFDEEKTRVMGVKGAYRTKQKTIAAQFAQQEFMYRYRKMSRSKYIDFVDTYAAAFNKEVFLGLGGFDTSFPVANNEDVEFSYRMAEAGHKMVFNPEAIVYHQHPDTLYKYLRLKFGRAYWRMAVYEKFPDKIKSDSYTPQTLKAQIVLANLMLLSLLFSFVEPRLQTVLLPLSGVLFLLSTLPFLTAVIDSQALDQALAKIAAFFKRGFIRACIEKLKAFLATTFLYTLYCQARHLTKVFFSKLRPLIILFLDSNYLEKLVKALKQVGHYSVKVLLLPVEILKLTVTGLTLGLRKTGRAVVATFRFVAALPVVRQLQEVLQRLCCTKLVMIPLSIFIIFLQGLVMGLGILWGLQPRRSTKSRFTQFFLFFLSDVVALVVALFTTYYVTHQILTPPWLGTGLMFPFHTEAALIFMGALLLIYFLIGLYKPSEGLSQVNEFVLLVKSTFIAGLATCGLLYFTSINCSYLVMALLTLLIIALVNVGRGLVRHFYARLAKDQGKGAQIRILIVGTKEIGHLICKKLEAARCVESVVVGFVSEETAELGTTILNHNVLGTFADLGRLIEDHNIHEVFVALPMMPQRDVLALIDQHSIKEGVHFHIIANMFDLISAEINIAEQKNIPIAYLKNERMVLVQQLVKRCFDLAVALVFTVLTAPVWLLIIAAIKIETDGPAFFRQERVGKGGKIFQIYKFRTMFADTDKFQYSPTAASDSRVTKVGRFLRKTSLDELPQFLNILKGEMSLVGPRPEMPFIVEKYENWERRRLTIKPGLTGLWQIMGRKDLPLHENLEYDFYYIKNQSLLLDLVILLKTLPLVLFGKGAY